MDPHGAVGYLALEEWQKLNPGIRGMFLETAHPVKFFDVVEPIIGQKIPMPKAIQDLMQKEQKRIRMKADYEELKSFLMAQS